MSRYEPPVLTWVPLLALPNGHAGAAAIPSGSKYWYTYALAYKDAADSLASLVDVPEGPLSRLAVPMMFLYRHHVELHLKSLLSDAGELLDDPQSIPPAHYLLTLWKRVRALLLKISSNSDGAWFVRADGIVEALDAIDPGSFAFRYPVDKPGAPSIAGGLEVDPTNVRVVIDELHTLLDGASALIDVYMGIKAERASEYGS